MKRIAVLLLLSLLSLPGYSQVVAIQNDRQRILYLCVDNPITVAVDGHRMRKVTLTTDNGNVTKDENYPEGHFIIHPQHLGKTVVYTKVKTWKGIKTIDSSFYRIDWMPYSLTLGKENRGEMTKSMLCILIAPTATIECCGFDARYPIVGFTVKVVRNNEEIFKRVLADLGGARIDSVTNAFFKALNNMDRVIFTGVTIKDCMGNTKTTEPMEFIVTEAEKYHRTKRGDVIVDPITGTETIEK